eukprot:scaffold25087_cov19-Tisochrysis_lutea.AAC.1
MHGCRFKRLALCLPVMRAWANGFSLYLMHIFRFKRLVEYWVRSSKPEAGQKEPKLYLLQHCTMAALMEPSLVEDAVQFCMLQRSRRTN